MAKGTIPGAFHLYFSEITLKVGLVNCQLTSEQPHRLYHHFEMALRHFQLVGYWLSNVELLFLISGALIDGRLSLKQVYLRLNSRVPCQLQMKSGASPSSHSDTQEIIISADKKVAICCALSRLSRLRWSAASGESLCGHPLAASHSPPSGAARVDLYGHGHG